MSALAFIDEFYDRLLQQPWFTERPGQRELSRDVYHSLTVPGSTYVAEAPTGTGKTFAYLAGGLAATKITNKPLVVATATIALQEQIMVHDIAALASLGLLNQREVVLVKGRNRYYCPFMAEKVEAASSQGQLFEATETEVYRGQDLVQEMHAEFLADSWNGDLDSWTKRIPVMWEEVACNSSTCIGKSCKFAKKCRYFDTYSRAAFAKIIVTNQNLLLADLALRQDGASVLPVEEYMAVFDEGHHLPDKAKEADGHELRLNQGDWLAKVAAWRDSLYSVPGLEEEVVAKTGHGLDEAMDATTLEQMMANLQMALVRHLPEKGASHYFRSGFPTEIAPLLFALSIRLGWTSEAASVAMEVLSGMVAEGRTEGEYRMLLGKGAAVERGARDLAKAAMGLGEGEHEVKWSFATKEGPGLASSAMEGNHALTAWLWSSDIPVVIVSATLRALGTFNRFSDKAGLPARVKTRHFDPVLPYHNSKLVLCDPGVAPDQEGFEEGVVAALNQLVDPKEGTLVLFTSIELMRRVRGRLSMELGVIALQQFSLPIRQLVARHKASIDLGRGSVLMGVDSFAEGLDLPGGYCTHVVIVRLPFARPNNPIEQARKEADPDGYFANSMLPDASVKLVQAVGRLVRRESDIGRITILDNRLILKRYGKQLLDSLPPFQRSRVSLDRSVAPA